MFSTGLCNKMDVAVKKEDNEESIITIEDFPFICRICCQRRDDLRPFEEEQDLFDLFHTIRKTDVQSTTMFPRNVCDECINKLEDISGLIQTFKCTDIKPETNLTPKKEIDCGKALEAGGTIKETTKEAGDYASPTSCRICSSPSHLKRLMRQKNLLQLFQNITNVYGKGENCYANKCVFCKSCIDKLKDISSFIDSSLCNDMKIEYAVGKCEFVKTENCSDATEDYAPTETAAEKKMIMSEIMEEEEEEDTVNIKLEVSDYEPDATTSQMCLSYNNEERPFQCDCCEKSFALNDQLQQHMRSHTGEKRFKCDLCDKSYTLKHHLEKHVQKHSSSSRLRIHKEGKRVKCEHCGTILLEYFLDNHMRRHMLKCRFCGETFTEKPSFEEHLRTHAGEKAYKCHLCDKSFHLPSSLRRHILIHSEEKPYKCHLCKSSFKQDTYLHRHLAIHTREERYKCDSCGESFTQPSYLQKHMLIHSGEKLFTCNECGKNFRRASCLQRHLLTHTEDKLYTCNDCGKTFKLLSYLRRHLLTHPGGQEYHCDKCDKVYVQESRFRWHMWTHRNEKQTGCE